MKINLTKRRYKIVISEENYLEEAFDRCPFCGSGFVKYIGTIHPSPDINIYTDFLTVIGTVLSDRPSTDNKTFACNNCHIGYFNPQPTGKYLQAFYKSYDLGDNRRKKTDHLRLANHIIKNLGNLSPGETVRILDFGGGDGAVAKCLGKCLLSSGFAKKIDISIVDFNTIPDRSENSISQNSYETLDLIPPSEEFDIVIASAVL